MDNANTEIEQRFIVTVAGLYLLAIGFVSGMIIDRIRFYESRSALLATLEEDNHRVHERRMAIEREESRERSVP